MRTVLTVGSFDLFHEGHVNFLWQCWKIAGNYWTVYGDDITSNKVVVGLNADEFIKDFKGKKPVYTYAERRALLGACKYVYNVEKNLGDHDLRPLIEKVKPNFLVVGSDWAKKDYYAQTNLNQMYLDSKGVLLCYIPYTEGISSTQLKERILNSE